VKTHAGLWVDHRKAVVVTVSEQGETIRRLESGVAKHVRYSGGSGTAGSREGKGEDTRERHHAGELAKYYDDILACVRDAQEILILGPGEAKTELKSHLERAGLGARIVGVEASDKLTEPQIVARVRERFVR
jgi:stalled ribosome rescue protein Dom34